VTLFASDVAMEIQEDGDLPDGGNPIVRHAFKAIAPRSWARVIIEVDYGGAGVKPTVTLMLEQPPGAAPTTALDHVPITPTVEGATATRVYAGIDYTLLPLAAGWRVYVDDVVVEAP
jgi:hypothetical protein